MVWSGVNRLGNSILDWSCFILGLLKTKKISRMWKIWLILSSQQKLQPPYPRFKAGYCALKFWYWPFFMEIEKSWNFFIFEKYWNLLVWIFLSWHFVSNFGPKVAENGAKGHKFRPVVLRGHRKSAKKLAQEKFSCLILSNSCSQMVKTGFITFLRTAMANPNRLEGQIMAKQSCWGPKSGLFLKIQSILLQNSDISENFWEGPHQTYKSNWNASF